MNSALLKQVVLDQRYDFLKEKSLIERDIDLLPFIQTRQIVVITGVRRCGKSSLLYLLKQAHNLTDEQTLFLNFDDERLTNFSNEDFNKIHTTHIELFGSEDYICFFDEIHNVDGWERYVNRLYEKGIKIYLTGSNAKLLSSEIASSLTGRNITLELFPFSYKEFLTFQGLPTALSLASEQLANLKGAFRDFFNIGGFPLVIKEKNHELLHNYYQDIIYKDVIARYNITQQDELKQLSIYLTSNISKTASYKTLQHISGIKSTSGIKNYLDYLSQAYLCFLVKKYNPSLKKQILNPRKVYWIDHALAKRIGFRLSDDHGRMLENIVFLELKRRKFEIYYYQESRECDFILKKGNQITQAIQVSWVIFDDETKDREIKGLEEAMDLYKLKNGYILTENEEETVKLKNKTIFIKPVWKWLLEKQMEI